jgi:hypothetical protein
VCLGFVVVRILMATFRNVITLLIECRNRRGVREGAVSGRPSIESFAPLQASTDLGKERDGAEGAAETALLQ